MVTEVMTTKLQAALLCLFNLICCSGVWSFNCTSGSRPLCPQPCGTQTSCRSWLLAEGRPHRPHNVTCRRADAAPGSCQCEAKYFTSLTTKNEQLGRPIFCLEGELAVCSGTAYNLTCPAGSRLKIWYAYFGRGQDGACSVRGLGVGVSSGNDSRSRRSVSALTSGSTPTPTRLPASLPEACLTPVLTSAIRQCDGRRSCWLQPDELLADVTDCRSVPEPYMLMDFACLGSSTGGSSAEQELFFRWGLLLIGALFPTSLLALLVTVQLRKKRQDAFKMNSMHLPLTRHENPEV